MPIKKVVLLFMYKNIVLFCWNWNQNWDSWVIESSKLIISLETLNAYGSKRLGKSTLQLRTVSKGGDDDRRSKRGSKEEGFALHEKRERRPKKGSERQRGGNENGETGSNEFLCLLNLQRGLICTFSRCHLDVVNISGENCGADSFTLNNKVRIHRTPYNYYVTFFVKSK